MRRPRSRPSPRGSFTTTMLVVGVVMVVAFALAAMAFHHWGFSQHEHNRLLARNLVESAAALAVARCTDDPSYGVSGSPVETVTVTNPDVPKSWAAVSFSPARAGALGIPLSRNNATDTATDGLRGLIPPRTVEIVAHGEAGDAAADLQVLLYVPAWPLALIASGNVLSRGGLVVSGVRDVRDYPGAIEMVAPEKRVSANVASNSGGEAAVDLGSGASVRGNVQAVGRVTLESGAEVKGEILQYADAAPIPDLDFDQYLALASGFFAQSRALNVGPGTADLEVNWMTRCHGNLDVNGTLQMNGGVLVVLGNLRVTGGVRGKGTILVTGTTTIEKGADLNADQVVALLSKGDITLVGQDRSSSYLQGIVYTEGNLSARRLTILGSLVTRAPQGSGNVSLQDVSIICAPITLRVRAGLPFDPRVDDDETIFEAFAYPDPANPARALLYSVAAMGQICDGGVNLSFLGGGTNLTRRQAEALIIRLDAEHGAYSGSNGDHLSINEDGKRKMRAYFDDLESARPGSQDLLNLDVNKLLKPFAQPRFLQWTWL